MLAPLDFAYPPRLESKCDVFPHGHVWEKGQVLEDQCGGSLIRPYPYHDILADANAPACWAEEPRDHAQHGRFATARGPENREELPRVDHEVGRIYGGEIAELRGYLFEDYFFAMHCSSPT